MTTRILTFNILAAFTTALILTVLSHALGIRISP